MQHWLDRGYATFSMTDRGFHESCGSQASQDAAPAACANGYIRLIDNRYEVRDAQEFAGQLADEGLVDPQRIGSIGGSYGGGMSMALGALAQPHGDARLQPRPLDQPGRQADADRGRGAEHPVDRPRLLAAAERQHARLRRRRPVSGPDRGREAVAGRRALLLRHSAPRASTPRSAPTRPPTSPAGGTRIERASRTGPTRRRSSTRSPSTTPRTTSTTRSPPAPMLMSSGFTDDLFPAERDDPLLQPDQDRVPGRAPGALLRRLRPPARAEQGRRHRAR